MDISTILPLLMNQKGGGMDAKTTSLLQMMNGGRGGNAFSNPNTYNQSNDFADILNAMGNGKQNGNMGGMGTMLNIMQSMNNTTDPTVQVMSLLSAMNQKKAENKKRPMGLTPIKAFIPNEILGKIVKWFG